VHGSAPDHASRRFPGQAAPGAARRLFGRV
jgi:hypothetical protein